MSCGMGGYKSGGTPPQLMAFGDEPGDRLPLPGLSGQLCRNYAKTTGIKYPL